MCLVPRAPTESGNRAVEQNSSRLGTAAVAEECQCFNGVKEVQSHKQDRRQTDRTEAA